MKSHIMKWLPDEDQFLREHYNNLGAERCALLLRRTRASVHRRTHRLNIKLTNPYSFTQSPKGTKNRPTLIYFISLWIEGVKYYKIGITTNSVEERMKSDFNKFKVKIEWEELFSTGLEAYKIEQRILLDYSNSLVNTGKLLSGNTETLTKYVNKKEYIE